MALQLRRGTAAQRLISKVVPAQGELLWTTDDNNLYMGDGVTEGGVLVTGKLGAYDVDGTFQQFYLIDTCERTGGVATFQMSHSHGLTTGDEVIITDSPNGAYDGTHTLTGTPTASSFTCAIAGADLPVQPIAVYFLSSAAFTDGAVVKWSAADQEFKILPITKADVGLDQVDNTSDANKPVSTAQQAALDALELGDLANVTLVSPAQDEVIAYNATTGQWENVPNAGGGGGGGGGTASFPETFFPYAGLGQDGTMQWVGTSEMFQPNSDTNFKAYKAYDQTPIQLETLEWNDHQGVITSTTTWNNLAKDAGDWAFSLSPQSYNISSVRAWVPSSYKNSNLANWIRDQAQYSRWTYGKMLAEDDPQYAYNTGYVLKPLTTPGDYTSAWENSFTLFGTGRSNPPLGSSHTFQEYSFVSSYPETDGKWVGPALIENDYASQAAAEADGWTVVQFGSNSGYRYYPSTGTDGATPITLPWTFTIGGLACNEAVFTSSGGIAFRPTGESPYAYPNSNSGAPNALNTLEERWAASTNHVYFALAELGYRGYSSRCMYKVINESPNRALVLRYKLNVQSYMNFNVEFTIRESDNNFQALFSPMYNSSGKTLQEVFDDHADFMPGLPYLGSGIVDNNGYITHLGYVCNQFNMNCHPYVLTDDVGRWIYQSTFNRSWLEPIFSAMGDVTQGSVGDLLVQTSSGYKFTTGTLLGAPLSDTSKVVEGTWVYNNNASFTNGNGNYYYYAPSTGYLDVQMNRRGVDGVDRFSIMSAWTSDTVIKLLVNGDEYTIGVFDPPTYNSTYQFFFVGIDDSKYDGPALVSLLSDSAKRSDVAYAPTVTAYTEPTNGQVLTYDSADGLWKPADPTGGGGGGVTSIIAGTNVTIDPVGGTGDVTINATGGGASALNDLTDVTITAAATGEVLRYNGSAWVDAQLAYGDISGTPSLATVATTGSYNDLTNKPTIPTNLTSLSDVTISSAATGEVLRYNGSQWVDAQLAYSDLTGTPTLVTDLDGLSDVTITNAAAGEVLRYNGAAWVDAQLDYGDLTGTPALVTDLDGLTDVTITAAATGEVLRYNGSAWVDAQLAYTDLSGTPTNLSQFTNDVGFITDITGENLGDLANVAVGSATNGDVLSYNGTNWVNSAAPPADISGSSIGQLNDVDTTTSPPSNGEGLIWNSTSGNWEPGTVSSGPIALNDLTDVTITSAATGEVLRYNGSAWVDAQLSYSDLTGTPSIPASINDLSDVTITGATTGEVLRWNGSAWVDATLDYSDLSGTPSLATVATSGDYNDLINQPSIPANINDLGDVTITGATTGQILEYNGSAWVNVANSGGGGPTSIDDLTDVDTTTAAPNVGQVLKWDGANWIPGNDNTGGGGSATLGRGDGGDLDFGTVDSAFVFAVYGGGDIDTTVEDKPVELVTYEVDGGELT